MVFVLLEPWEGLRLPQGSCYRLRKRSLDGHVPLIRTILPAGSVCFSVHCLLWMEEACAKIFGLDSAMGSSSGAMNRATPNGELTPYPDDDDGNQSDFADDPFHSHDDVRARLLPDFTAVHKLCPSASPAKPGDFSGVLTMALQNVDAIPERNSAGASKLKHWNVYASLKKLLQRRSLFGLLKRYMGLRT